MPSYQYRDSHVKAKTVSPTVLSLTWESPYLGKTVFILRRGPGSRPVCNGTCTWSVKALSDFLRHMVVRWLMTIPCNVTGIICATHYESYKSQIVTGTIWPSSTNIFVWARNILFFCFVWARAIPSLLMPWCLGSLSHQQLRFYTRKGFENPRTLIVTKW